MNNYLLQILKETKTIIIPGLGALTVTNEATGEIMFMSFLKHDDGNLAKYIAEKEGMDINDAKNLIAKYVREIQAEVDKGDKYSMYQFGTFSKADGEIVFDQWESSNVTESISEQEPIVENVVPIVEIPEIKEEVVPEVKEEPAPIVEVTPVNSVTEEIVIEEPIVDEVIPVIEVPIEETTPIVEPKVTEVSEEKIPEPKIEESKLEETVPPIVETVVVQQVVESVSTPTPSETPKEVPAKKVEPPRTKSPKEQLKAADKQKEQGKKKKKTGVFAYILWGFVILVLGGGTYVAVQYDTLKKDFPILAELTGEEIEDDKKDSLVSLGESDPVANPDSMPEVETVPGNEVETTEPESTVEETKEPEKTKTVEPVKKPEVKVTPKPVAKPKPVVKPTPKPVSTPSVTTTYKPRPKPATFPTPNLSNPYHIIAGSFSSKTNAQNFATKLKGMGMSNLSIGEAGGLYKVSINGYSSESEAKAALSSVQSVAPGAWVFEWK